MELETLIKQPEGRRLEFKENLSDGDRIERTVIAFSNDAGGEIYLGIQNKPRKIIGFSEDEILKIEQQVSNIIFDNTQPNVIPDILILNHKGKYLLKIIVFPGSQVPYFLKSLGKIKGTFIRVGSSNKPADESIIQELERRKRNISFDSLPAYDSTIDKLDLTSFAQLFFEQTGKKLDKRAYEKLGLIIKEGKNFFPTTSAVLLSDNPIKAKEFHYSKVECARFKGVTTSETIDSQTVDESVCLQPDLVINFIKRNIKKGSEINGIYRMERWEYPLDAIREVIINAIIHRDYSQLGRDIKVALFDDMLEITSPGTLPPSIDINNLSSGLSEIRNRTLAPVFKMLNLIEQWGTGFKKLNDELVNYPEIEVKFIEPGLSFQIQFIKKTYKIGTKPALSKHQVGIKMGLSWDQVGTKLGSSLEETKMLLQKCFEAAPIAGIMKIYNWSNRTKFKKKYINPMLEMNLIAMTLPDKPNSPNQKYIITGNGSELLNSLLKGKE
jgi:predicted HTH transcriptional regulator